MLWSSCETVPTMVVQSMDNTIHWINLYPVSCAVQFVNTFPLDSNLSVEQHYPPLIYWSQDVRKNLKRPGEFSSTRPFFVQSLVRNNSSGPPLNHMLNFSYDEPDAIILSIFMYLKWMWLMKGAVTEVSLWSPHD